MAPIQTESLVIGNLRNRQCKSCSAFSHFSRTRESQLSYNRDPVTLLFPQTQSPVIFDCSPSEGNSVNASAPRRPTGYVRSSRT